MNIKFDNGSKIKSIDSAEETKRGYIRGKRFTNKEYRDFLYNEQIQAENRVSKLIKELSL